MVSLIERARKSGTCPPSLLSEQIASNEDGFEEAALRTFDAAGTYCTRSCVTTAAGGVFAHILFSLFLLVVAEFQLTSDMAAAESFSYLLQVSSWGFYLKY